MPKITAGGGPTNVREAIDPAVPTSAPAVELTREEDPHAPQQRPGEHVAFFESVELPAEEQPTIEEPGEQAEGSDLPPAVEPRPAKRGGRKSS